MKNQLRGCLKIKAEGRQLYKFINAVHRGRFCCFGQYCKGEVFHCEIYRGDLSRMIGLAEEYGISLTYAEYETLSAKLLRYKRRIGLIAGTLLAAATLFYFSGVVMQIEIMGNTKVSDSAVLAALDELGIRRGTPIRDINMHYCENELRLMVDGVSWAGMRRTGNRLVVELTELNDKPEMVHKRMPCNVIAAHEGKITYTSVLDGQLMRIVGDYVYEGDLLVSGICEDSFGHTTFHHAMGTIRGIYKETVTFTDSFSSNLCLPTGNSDSRSYLRLFNLNIPLFIGKNGYASSSSEVSESTLRLFGRSVPIGVTTEHITETAMTERVYSETELEQLLNAKIFAYERNFLSDVTVISREISRSVNEDSLTLTVDYTLEGDIGSTMEVLIK